MVDKPAGMPSAPDSSQELSVLEWAKSYIKVSRQKPGNVFVGLVHRLDRPVGGVMVFAKTSKAASRLSEQIRTGAFRKLYIGVTPHKPPSLTGELHHQLLKDRKHNRVALFAEHKRIDGAKLAVTRFRLKESKNGLFILELEPVTGRPHQLRAQCAAMGCPLLGDLKYGGEKDTDEILQPGAIGLMAWRLTFLHPVNLNTMEFERMRGY